MADSKFAVNPKKTRGMVLNKDYGGFGLSEEGKNFLIQKKRMSPERVDEIEDSDDVSVRMDPLFVAEVRKNPIFFSGDFSSFVVEEVPVDAIMADAVSISDYDGIEDVKINWEKVALWKKSNEQPKKFATLEATIIATIEAANIGDAPKAEVMRLLEEFKKTIPEPMPSKPVPDELPCSDSEDEE